MKKEREEVEVEVLGGGGEGSVVPVKVGMGVDSEVVVAERRRLRALKGRVVTDGVCEEICVMVAGGATLEEACLDIGVKVSQFWYAHRSREKVRDMYREAVVHCADAWDAQMADTLSEMRSGVLDSNQAKLIIMALQFRMSRANPRKYGEKIAIDATSIVAGGGIALLSAGEKLSLVKKARSEGKTVAQVFEEQNKAMLGELGAGSVAHNGDFKTKVSLTSWDDERAWAKADPLGDAERIGGVKDVLMGSGGGVSIEGVEANERKMKRTGALVNDGVIEVKAVVDAFKAARHCVGVAGVDNALEGGK